MMISRYKPFLVLLLLLFSSSPAWACKFKSVTFDTDFSMGALASCEQLSAHTYKLIIEPENTPINNSAWYAFKVSSTTEQSIDVTLEYKDGKHRYPPKFSYDGERWQLLAYKKLKKDKDTISARFTLFVNEEPVWVAGQEIINASDYDDWTTTLAAQHNLKRYKIGASVEKRDIWALESNAQSNRWLVIVGRQHPPEITGAQALFSFVETLYADIAVARKFREQFNILIVPLVNPDGVEKGHWRHNVGGKDLNRDWYNFSQPETTAVHQKLQEIVKAGGKIEFALDFHSTWKDLFYTMPVDYGLEKPEFSKIWLESLDKTLPGFEVDERPGVSKNPGVFKQYIADKYGVHAVTYEVDDDADRNQTKTVAKTSAYLLMKLMVP
jgi:predicted deacylase